MWSATKTEQNTGLAEYFGGQSQIHKSTDCSAKKTTRKHKCPKMFYFWQGQVFEQHFWLSGRPAKRLKKSDLKDDLEDTKDD